MPEYYIHIGAPKTGTTSIQSLLRRNKKIIEKLGYSIVLPNNIRKTSFLSYYLSQHTNGRIKSLVGEHEAINSLQSILSDRVTKEKVIISEEGFILDSMPNYFWQGTFGGIELAAKTLKKFFGSDSKIIIYIRRQDTFIQSCYTHKVKYQAASFSFKDYINKTLNLPTLSWENVIKPFVEVFGKSNVFVRCYEDWKLGAEFAFSEFLKLILKDNELDDLQVEYSLNTKAMNSSYSTKALEIAQRCNQCIPVEKKQLFMKFLVDNFPVKDYGKPVLWDEVRRQELVDYYQKANREIFEKYLPDRSYDDTWGSS